MQKGDAAPRDGKTAPPEFAQAGAFFEEVREREQGQPHAPNALFNAGIAYDKAKEPKKAVAAREALLASYPDAKVRPKQNHGDPGRHAGRVARVPGLGQVQPAVPDALARRAAPLHRPPEPGRGPAGAEEAGRRGRQLPALRRRPHHAPAKRIRTPRPASSTRPPRCRPTAKKPAEAKKALQQLVALKGVTDVVAKFNYQTDAKERLAKDEVARAGVSRAGPRACPRLEPSSSAWKHPRPRHEPCC